VAELKVKSGEPRVSLGSLGLTVAVGVMVAVAVGSGVAVSSDRVGSEEVGWTNAAAVCDAAKVPATRVAMTSTAGVAFEAGKLQEVKIMTMISVIKSIFLIFPLISDVYYSFSRVSSQII
jgi:hypothetical protein